MSRKILIFCLLIMLSALGAAAKKLNVERFGQLETDISARINQREDLNGEKCALIKVFLPVEGCRFEGNIGDAKFDVNEYWVYVSPGSRRIKVKCPGFETLDVDFGSYSDISKVEPLLTYGLVISDYDQLDIIQNPDGNMLYLDIVPEGKRDVTVVIDGRQQTVDKGRVSAFLRSGEHTYSVTSPGCLPSSGTFSIVKDRSTSLKVRLKSEEGTAQKPTRKSNDIYDDIYGDSFAKKRNSKSEKENTPKIQPSFSRRYRGNVEFWGGVNICKYDLDVDTDIENVAPLMGVTTTHGYQLFPFLFIGAGAGVYVPTMWANKYYEPNSGGISPYEARATVEANVHNETSSAYCCMIPVFLDLKLEVGVDRKFSPYLDMKVGYQFGAALNKYRVYANRKEYYTIKSENSLYLQPSIGVRFRISERCGINFGVSYVGDIKRKLIDIESVGLGMEHVLSSMNGSGLAVNVGFDF